MMPPKTRDIICYRHQKMPYKEISRKVGAKTVSAVEMTLKRALVTWPILQNLFPVKTAKQARWRRHWSLGRVRGWVVGICLALTKC